MKNNHYNWNPLVINFIFTFYKKFIYSMLYIKQICYTTKITTYLWYILHQKAHIFDIVHTIHKSSYYHYSKKIRVSLKGLVTFTWNQCINILGFSGQIFFKNLFNVKAILANDEDFCVLALWSVDLDAGNFIFHVVENSLDGPLVFIASHHNSELIEHGCVVVCHLDCNYYCKLPFNYRILIGGLLQCLN